jgi:hypothetical protein
VVARAVVTTKTHAFASLFGVDVTIVKIDRASGANDAVLSLPFGPTEIALGLDLLYVFQPESGEIWSLPLEDSRPRPEPVSNPSSMGASREGAYYVSYTEAEEEPYLDTYELWFRSNGSSTWQLLRSGASGAILASSASGVVFAVREEAGTRLHLLQGPKLVDHGVVPADVDEAAVVGAGIVAQTASDDELQFELWWPSLEEEPVHYAVGHPQANEHYRLHAADGAAALYYEENGAAFVQQFGRNGPNQTRLGLPAVSVIAHLDQFEIWFAVWDTWVARRFLHTTYLDFTP